MLLLKKKSMINQLIRFLSVGLFNTLIGISVIYMLLFYGVNNYISNISGYIFGIILSYFLHKYYTFKSQNGITKKEILKFLFVFLISYCINIIILYLSLHFFSQYLSQLLAIIGYSIVNYLLNKLYTFKKIKRGKNVQK